MKIDLLKENRRCPWCGNLAESPAKVYFTTKECSFCHKKYTWYWNLNAVIAEFWDVFAIGINIYLLHNDQISIPVFILILIIVSFILPSKFFLQCYKRVNNYDSRTRYNLYAYIVQIPTNQNDIDLIRKNMIYPICFSNKSNTYISDYMCVKIVDIEKSRDKLIMEMQSLPYGNNIDESKVGGAMVHIFFNGSKLCDGTLLRMEKNNVF